MFIGGAQAQLMRWKEEVTLTAYEMQWTVWYFSYMSQKWILPQHIFKSPVSFTKAKTAHSHFLKNTGKGVAALLSEY